MEFGNARCIIFEIARDLKTVILPSKVNYLFSNFQQILNSGYMTFQNLFFLNFFIT